MLSDVHRNSAGVIKVARKVEGFHGHVQKISLECHEYVRRYAMQRSNHLASVTQ